MKSGPDSLPLVSSRVVLKSLTPADAELVAEYQRVNREHFEKWTPAMPDSFYTVETQRRRLASETQRTNTGEFIRLWVFVAGTPDEIIGDISFSNILRGRFLSCFLGYNLGGDYLGRGLMTEALNAAIDYAFGQVGLHRLEANIRPENLASIRTAERLGFQHEGLSRRLLMFNGKWEDYHRYVLLSDDPRYVGITRHG